MIQHLVITAMGTDRPGISNQVVRLVTQAQGNIIDSRITLFGNEFTLIMLVSGNNNSIARIESNFPLLGQQQDLITMMKRTTPPNTENKGDSLEISVELDDGLGITEQFTQFFAHRHIGLSALSAQTQPHVTEPNKKRFVIRLSAQLSKDIDQTQLMQDFDQLCDQVNAQGQLHFISPPSP